MANHVRRQARKTPSLKKHGFSALLLLAIVILSLFIWINAQNSENVRLVQSEKEIPLPEPVAIDTTTNGEKLPDLLAPDNIPLDENPTDILEMIGTATVDADPSTGPRPPSVNIDPVNTDSQPKTILIDGSPLGGTQSIITIAPPLPRAPIAGLTRTTAAGEVPHPAPDGRTALKSYARPFSPVAGKSYVSVIVGGLGVNTALTRRAINELPADVSLAFAAESANLQSWINQARARGHEVLIELPMEGSEFNSNDPGAEYTLMVGNSESVNIGNLDYLLSRAQGYFAVTNYGGDKLVRDQKALEPILKALGEAGLGVIYDGSEKNTRFNTVGQRVKTTTVTAQTLLDADTQSHDAVIAILSSLQPSESVKVPIGMGFSFASTIDGINDWVAAKPRNTELAPASYALAQNR
jgi:polysaccharide deacetylase 2 family uncharacterized protein YibQ